MSVLCELSLTKVRLCGWCSIKHIIFENDNGSSSYAVISCDGQGKQTEVEAEGKLAMEYVEVIIWCTI